MTQKGGNSNIFEAYPSFCQTPAHVGLSNILDREHGWRNPAKGPHGKVVGAAVMDRELLFKVSKGIKAVGRIETFLVFPVAALYFAVMPRRVRPDKLVPDSKFSRRCFK